MVLVSQDDIECGSACNCAASCERRTFQQGLTVPITLKKATKGWEAEAAADIAAGQFVCLYVGERLRGYDAVPGGANHALLVRLVHQLHQQ